MHPVRHLAPKILMAVNYFRCRQAQWLGLAEAVYHEEEGATLHTGAHKHGMQYDGGD